MPTSLELSDIFQKRDRLEGITAEFAGPKIAAALGISPPPHEPLEGGWSEPERLAETLPDVMQFDLELMPESCVHW